MKKSKKIVAMAFVAVLLAATLVGCGGKKEQSGNSATDIEIAYWNSGLSTAWLDAVIAAFEEKYPEYNVNYTANASSAAVTAAYRNADSNTVDLYMAIKEYDTTYMEPLDDILDSKADGESKTIREKITPAYLELEKAGDGKVYSLTYGGGVTSFVYNKKLFEQAGVRSLPRTTDELASACDTLASSNIMPICHFQSTGYWDFMNEVFFAQYAGMDYYLNNFYACTDKNGTSPSKDVFTAKDGRYEVMLACEKIVTPDYVLSGSNSNDHVTMQTEFLNGKAAMMINGAWMANEMSSTGSVANFDVMKTPVLSAIVKNMTTVTKEGDLRRVITAIDSVVDGEKDITAYQSGDNYVVDGLEVSAADWEYIYNARYTVASNFSGECMFVPNYSNAKEGAKEFIKFLYSDEGYKIYADTLHMALPVTLSEGELDTSEWDSFEKTMYQLLRDAKQIATQDIMSKHKIFYEGGARLFADYSFVNLFCSNNVADRQNADEAWDSMIKKVEKDYANTWLANIGE